MRSFRPKPALARARGPARGPTPETAARDCRLALFTAGPSAPASPLVSRLRSESPSGRGAAAAAGIRSGITTYDAGHRITELHSAMGRYIDAIAPGTGHARVGRRPS